MASASDAAHSGGSLRQVDSPFLRDGYFCPDSRDDSGQRIAELAAASLTMANLQILAQTDRPGRSYGQKIAKAKELVVYKGS